MFRLYRILAENSYGLWPKYIHSLFSDNVAIHFIQLQHSSSWFTTLQPTRFRGYFAISE